MDEPGCIFGVALVAGLAFLAYIGYWPWIAALVVLVFVIWLWWAITIANRESTANDKRKAEAAEKLAMQKAKAMTFVDSFPNYLTSCLVIDSNIWMNENYDSFFRVLELVARHHNFVIDLYGPQFDEIANIKKATVYGEERNKRSRLAINRIEHLQKNGRLTIKPVSVDAKKNAYADPLLVKLIDSQARDGKRCTFFSDDKELRIRVRQHLIDSSNEDWKIVEMDSILENCNLVSELLIRDDELDSSERRPNDQIQDGE